MGVCDEYVGRIERMSEFRQSATMQAVPNSAQQELRPPNSSSDVSNTKAAEGLERMKLNRSLLTSCLLFSSWLVLVNHTAAQRLPDIRKLSQHFIDAKNTGSWQFGPRTNIKDLSLTEHRGLVTIHENGKGQDIKGLLKKPISLKDYPAPWEFHLGILQNHLAQKGLSEKQINYAIGLNLAVTFSDPKTWPKDRSKKPADLKSLQLFVVHLGSIGENYRLGIPAVRRSKLNMGDHSPEVYMFYGRGDLAPKLNGNWNFAYSWVGPDPTDAGTWSKRGGPADRVIRFRVSMLNPTTLQIGAGYGVHPGWRMKTVSVSQFGPITGIWEIGPIVSLDRWIPDVLSKELKLDQPPVWLKSFANRQKVLGKASKAKQTLADINKTFKVQRPDPRFAYYIDYATFHANGPANLDHLSDEFNVPGFLADQKYYVEGNAICETYSNPGNLTVTLFGHNSSWAMCPILRAGGVDFSIRKPPFEIETSFVGPGDDAAWNLWWNVGMFDRKKKFHPWQPGLKFIPGKGVQFFDIFNVEPDQISRNKKMALTFPKGLPVLPPGKKTIGMKIQIPDANRVRIGFRVGKKSPWVFSSTYDAGEAFGGIARFAYPCLVSFTGRGVGFKGWGSGNYPRFQRFKIDYLRFKYGNR